MNQPPNIAALRAARERTKGKGAKIAKAFLNTPMTPARRAKLREAAQRGAAKRKAQGDLTFQYLLVLARSGLTLQEAMAQSGLSENGVRKNLRDRLGTGAWPPVQTGE